MHHLNRAQIAKHRIVNVQINSELENISRIPRIITRTHRLTRHQTYFCSFVNALIIQDSHEKNKIIHRIISINFRNILGAQMVTIQHPIVMNAKIAITHIGHFFGSDFVTVVFVILGES